MVSNDKCYRRNKIEGKGWKHRDSGSSARAVAGKWQ